MLRMDFYAQEGITVISDYSFAVLEKENTRVWLSARYDEETGERMSFLTIQVDHRDSEDSEWAMCDSRLSKLSASVIYGQPFNICSLLRILTSSFSLQLEAGCSIKESLDIASLICDASLYQTQW